MKQITDTTTTPPGGWVYIEPTTGVEFRELNYQGLIGNIRRHRDAMGLVVHGPWVDEVQDIMVQINPLIPHEEIGKPARRFTADDVHRFVSVMNDLRGQELVGEDEQKRRADICATCPKNGIINCKFCGWLATEITGMMRGRPIPRVDEIFKHSCTACGCDLTAKTACPLPVLKKVDEQLGEPPDYDPRCWMLE